MSFVDPAFAQMFGGTRRMRQPAFGQLPQMQPPSGLMELPELPTLEPEGFGGLPSLIQQPPMQAFRPPQQQEPQYDFELETPEEQKNILSGYQQAAIGGLQKVGNLLGTPGDVVRNLIAGKGASSFSPLAAPTSSENRTSGRDLLRQYGVAGPEDTWTNFLGGLAVDIATDPLTPLTLLGGSLSKGGKIASKAGLSKDARFALARKLDKEVGDIGPRQAQTTVTLEEMLPFANRRQRSVIDEELGKLTGLERQKALTQPLGSMASYGLPGLGSIQIGSTAANQRVAETIDNVLKTMQWYRPPGFSYAPINAARTMFDRSIRETTNPTAQAYAQRAYRQQQELDYARRMATSDLATKLEPYGLLAEDRQAELRSILEAPSELANAPLPLQNSVAALRDAGFSDPQKFADLKDVFNNPKVREAQPSEVKQAVKTLRREYNVKTDEQLQIIQKYMEGGDVLDRYPPEVKQIVEQFHSQLAEDMRESALLGIPREAYVDPVARYFPRYKSPEFTKMETQTNRFAENDPSQKQRLAQFRGIVDQTATINAITTDPDIRQLIEANADVREIADLIGEKYGDKVPRLYVKNDEFKRNIRVNKAIEKKNVARIANGEPPIPLEQPKKSNQHLALAKMVENMNDTILDKGLLPNSPVADFLVSRTMAARSQEQIRNAAAVLAEPGVISFTKERDKTVKLSSLLGKMKMRGGAIDRESGLLADIAEAYYPPAERQRVNAANKVIREQNKKLKSQGLPQMPLEQLQKQGDEYDISESEGFLYAIARAMEARGKNPGDIRFKDAYVSKEIADNITAFVRPFTQPEAVRDIFASMDTFLNINKAYLTGVRPAFHVRNGLSAAVKNSMRGILSPQAVKDIFRLLRGGYVKDTQSIPAVRKEWERLNPGRSVDEMTDEDGTLILGRILNASGQGPRLGGELTSKVGQTVDPEAGSINEYMGGIGGRGNKLFSAREFGRKITGRSEDASWNWKALADVDRQALIVAGKYLGGAVEAFARSAPMIKLLRDGYDPVQAARIVAQTQVDYSARAYTNFELQRMARLFPFYKFTRGTIPEEFLEFIRRPGGTQAQLVKAIARASESDQLTPDYIAESVSLPVEGTPLATGAPEGTDRYITGFGFAFEDPLSFLSGGLRGAGGEALSRMTPFLKAPIEWISGETFFQRTPQGGRELTDTDPTIGRILANVTGAEKPVKFLPRFASEPLEFLAANSPISPFLTMARQATDPRKNAASTALNLLTGVKVSDVSPAVKDQLLRGIIEQQMVSRGAKQFLRTYYPKTELPGLSEQERNEILQLQSIANMLAQRTKERKAAKEAEKEAAKLQKVNQFQNN